ncbi:hypothetical protein ACVWZA_001510 [Sphingomonas sp. UYAg733]
MRGMIFLTAAAFVAGGSPAAAEEPGTARLFSYTLIDRAAFEAGYRAHLGWHAERQDRLVWYAWHVTEGDRRGSFIDGTFGTTLSDLEARPDQQGDSADFAQSAGPHARSTGITTWSLWAAPTTATPLEQRRPGDRLAAFFVTVKAGQIDAFEAAAKSLTSGSRGKSHLSWYRSGDADAGGSYMLLVHGMKSNRHGALAEILRATYRADPAAMIGRIDTVRAESWLYAPRLSLIPGQSLAR